MSKEYLELRLAAQLNNATMARDHPCKAGLARCCEAETPVTLDDQHYIMEGIRSCIIPQDTVTDAIQRAKLAQNKRCAFLNGVNWCSIYDRRPLICVATGTTGVPNSAETLRQVLSNPKTKSEGVAFTDLTSTMCHKCHKILAKKGVRITASALVDSQDIYSHYLSNHPATMRDFVLSLEQESSR